MMRRAIAFAALGALMRASSALAQQENDQNALERRELVLPEDQPTTLVPESLAQFTANIYRDAYTPEVLLRAVSSNMVVGLKQTENGYAIFGLQTRPAGAVDLYWTATLLRQGVVPPGYEETDEEEIAQDIRSWMQGLPEDFRDFEIAVCETSIRANTAEKLIALWQAMLGASHDGDERNDAYESIRFEAGSSAGSIHVEGPDGSLSFALFRFATRMENTCENARYYDNPEIVDFAPELDDLIARVAAR